MEKGERFVSIFGNFGEGSQESVAFAMDCTMEIFKVAFKYAEIISDIYISTNASESVIDAFLQPKLKKEADRIFMTDIYNEASEFAEEVSITTSEFVKFLAKTKSKIKPESWNDVTSFFDNIMFSVI